MTYNLLGQERAMINYRNRREANRLIELSFRCVIVTLELFPLTYKTVVHFNRICLLNTMLIGLISRPDFPLDDPSYKVDISYRS
jgi:hypothetical protein